MTGRFAPSPTGRMHLGNIFTALLAWLSVRSQGGRMLLRIEDLDPQRSRAAYAEQLRRDLGWLGLDWDGEMPPQSTRSPVYAAHFAKLEEQGLIYPCYCSRSELHDASAPHASDGTVLYSGACRDLTPEQLETLVNDLVDEYVTENLPGMTVRMEYLVARIRRNLVGLLGFIQRDLRQSGFQPVAFELRIDDRPDADDPGAPRIDPVELCDDAGHTVRVVGTIDRVDAMPLEKLGKTYLRVVDYKTGKKSFDYTNVLHGRGLQMLLYLFALVRQGGHLLHGEPLPAGVLYFPARIERVSVRDRLAQAEIEKERRKQLRRSGVLLNSDPVLEAMEPCGGSPRFLPYTLDKEGRKTGDLASFAQLAQLERFVFRTVAALGDELADGRIDPDPCIRDAKDSACAFCPYSEVCAGHEQPRWLKKITAEEFWQTLERREHG